jgi:hypothetical protein
LCITHWFHGGIWWDPFQFSFTGQTGFYNGNFSPQEQVLTWKRTHETTNLKTAETRGIEGAGVCNPFQVLLLFLHFRFHKFSLPRAKGMPTFAKAVLFVIEKWASVPYDCFLLIALVVVVLLLLFNNAPPSSVMPSHWLTQSYVETGSILRCKFLHNAGSLCRNFPRR